jgi:hypothetical protein
LNHNKREKIEEKQERRSGMKELEEDIKRPSHKSEEDIIGNYCRVVNSSKDKDKKELAFLTENVFDKEKKKKCTVLCLGGWFEKAK